ncbi:proliferation marker protein Ki-67 isoform X2 [Oncorhynchus tshawytscha]|uniref:proliferation marker protein Ki-67 isoform X2 n=1 Tax=Oncorhynchus tshawytscha TaxID=74940 RepID=UPI001C3D7EC7|nr:proliferation marker protein Ki-67 isoform X2 [Oncorhynchus tshawytscha]
MSLHGKIVVIKRSGGDGTEFPLTASCLFGRKPDCDIRIQLPHVSKEHCRIELNENKEVILTNLSSTNPTRVNGEVFQQSERLKHGDLITIIDRSFRFEYPPAPTPKKNRYSTASKSETPQVLHETQARDTSAKDGTKTADVKPKEDGSLEQNKPSSPFCELYQMFKQDLDSKTPKKALGTPASRLCPQNPISTRKVDGASVISTPKKAETENVSPVTGVTPKSAQKKRKSLKGRVVEGNVPVDDFIQLPPSILETPKGKRRSSKSITPTTVEEKSAPVSQRKSHLATPEKFTASEVAEQVSECPTAEILTTPTRRRSREATPIKSLITGVEPPADAFVSNQDQIVLTENSTASTPKIKHSRSPRPAGEKLQAQDVLCELEVTTPINVKQSSAKKRKSGDLETEFPTPLCKRKRVSFGGHLEPELFDKRLPPDSPLCKGATPGRRSLCAPKIKQSLLRRASAIGLIKEHEQSAPETLSVKGSPGKKASPKTPSPAKKSPKASAKTPSPVKKSPKASAKTPSPAKKSPKASAKTPSPVKKSPKASAKTPSPVKKSPRASAKTPSSAKKSPKAKTPSPGKEKTLKTAVKTPSPARRKSTLKDESQTPKAGKTPKTPASLPSANTTPTMQGRFSVSLVSTPSPTADQDSVLQPSVTVTPRVPLRRTTMSSTSKTTQKSAMKNSLQVIRRRSGVSRASMKVVNSWADIVKFGQTKTQAVIPTKKTTRVTKTKTVVPKPKTPVRKLIGHVSTGHADSPVTIVVGKAHRLKAIQPSGAAPKLVHNIAVLKKNMKMDEDLSGIADIFKTPARQRKSVVNVQSALKTPLRAQSTSMIESSVMNTPEETGEMVVSPLVVSTAKRGAYNSDAVTRLLRDGQESSFITEEADDSRTTQNEILALEMSSEESKEEQRSESKKSILTPKQKKPEQPECLTGVKRIMKTPRQKVQPIEDLRGKLMTTPRGPKASQEVSLVGVKELLTTPKQIAEPVEEMSGKVQDDYIHSETKEIHGNAISPKCLSGNVEFKMPLFGKIVVIKRSGGDGTVFPLTASCLFGRKPDCDICVKLPEVSKEHCRIELNENNEVILTNLSSTNPTRVNGEVLQQSEHLKHGDLITIIDRSFRFEYPQAPTPKRTRSSKQNTPRGPKALQKVSLGVVKTPKHVTQPVEEISGDAQEIPDAMTTEAVEELAAALAEAVEEEQPAPLAEAVQEVEEPVSAPAEAVEEKQPAPLAEAVQEVEEPVSAPAEAVEEKQPAPLTEAVQEVETVSAPAEAVKEEQPALLAEAVQEVEEPVSAPAEAVKEEQSALLAEAVQEVEEPVSAPAEAVEEKQPAPLTEAVQEVETVSAPAEAVQEVEEPAFAPAEAVEEEQPAPLAEPIAAPAEAVEDEQPAPLAEPIAAPAEAVEMAHLDSEEPSVPVKGRVKKTEGIVLPPARGRSARRNETSSVEAPAETMDSVAVQEKMAVDPVPAEKLKRGRKAKQASVERVESVQENAVESESAEIPPIEDQQPTSDVPVEKPRRGRKAKRASVEQVETVLENTEAVSVPVTETFEAQTPVVRSERGRKPKQDSVEEVEAGVLEIPPIKIVEAKEMPASVPVEKPQARGKRGKQESEEAKTMEENVVAVDIPTEEVEASVLFAKPIRGRKTKQEPVDQVESVSVETPIEEVEAQEQTTVAPVEKPKRGGRKTKQASVEQVEDHPVESLTVELQEQTTVAPVEKPKRGGRKTKQASVEQVEDHPVESLTVELQEQATVAPVEKPKRGGRKTKQASVEKVESEDHPVESLTVEAKEQTTVAPVEKPKRGGRKTKQASVEKVEPVEDHPVESLTVEAQEQTTVAPVEKPKRGGRKTKQASVEQVEPVEDHPVESLTVEAQEQTTVAPVEKPKRGGRKTKQASVEQVEPVEDHPVESLTVEAQEQTTVAPVEKPKRGGRKTKQASVEQVEPVEDHPIESLTVELQEQTTLASVEKPKRVGRRTKQDPGCVVPPVSTETPEETSAPPTENPKRGGRRAKQQKVPEVVEVENMVVQEVHLPAQTEVDARPEREEAVADAEELLEAPVVKPGWRRKAKAVVKDEVPAKRARRGAADSTKVPTVAEATVEVPTEPVKRGRRSAKSKVSADETTIAAESTPLEAEVTDTGVMTAVVRRGKAPKRGNAVSETTSDQANSIEGMETIDEDSKKTSKSVNWKPDLEVTHKVTPLPKQKTSRRNDTVPVTKVEEQPERSEEQQVVKTMRGRRARSYVTVKEETVQSTPSKRARHCTIKTSAAEATVPISKPVNERNAARSMTTEEADLSDKAVPKEPVKKTRRAAKSTAAAPVEATSTTPAVPEGETIPDATVVAATKGRGKATKGKTVSQDIEQGTESEQPCKPRRGRAARK